MTALINDKGELALVASGGLSSLSGVAMGAPQVAGPDEFRLYMDRVTKELLASLDGGAFAALALGLGLRGFDVSGTTTGVEVVTIPLTTLQDGDWGVLLANVGGSGSNGGFRTDQRVRSFQRLAGVCADLGSVLNLQTGSVGSSVGGSSTLASAGGQMAATLNGTVAGQTSQWRARGFYWLYNR